MRMTVVGALAGAFVSGVGLGAGLAWWLHRRTQLSPWNLYLLVAPAVGVWGLALVSSEPRLVMAAAVPVAGAVSAAAKARRLRLAALGAGGELREFERSRTMVWSRLSRDGRAGRARAVTHGERTRI